jgi:hypothetical protein
MFGWLKRPNYELLIEPGRITLAHGQVRVEVEPRLALAEGGRIVRVGGRGSEQNCRVVELLGPPRQEEQPRFEERFHGFEAVFRHLFRGAQKNAMLALRPDVRVYGASLLRALLGGEEQRFLREALQGAGAVNVEFAG